jgi:UrcA family protein
MNIIKSIRRSPLRSVALVTALSLVGGAQALAAEPADTHSKTINYQDLNLSTVAGASALYRRIKWAARDVCGYEGRSLPEVNLWQRCVQGAITDAVTTVNSPLLTAVHAGNSGDVAMTARR